MRSQPARRLPICQDDGPTPCRVVPPPMTGNQGPGVPDELRYRLLDVARRQWAPIWTAEEKVDAILAEIGAAGYAIVPADDVQGSAVRYGWPIHTDAAGLPDISVVCEGCGAQYYWPLNANGELELSPSQMGCGDCGPTEEGRG